MNIIDRIKISFEKKLPFVAYKKPNVETISGFFQNSNKLHFSKSYKESGFVFAPFDDKESTILFPKIASEFVTEVWDHQKCFKEISGYTISHNSEKNHLDLVEKTIEKIQNSEIKKIVISRKEELHIETLDVINIFLRLLDTYRKAMVYIWYHPKVGLWVGATPETLLKVEGAHFSTMSLAATKSFNGTFEVSWNAKELEEQLLVTEFISSQLDSISNSIEIDERETIQAGNVLHLRTALSGKLNDNSKGLSSLIKVLHPTPAVCGLPREASKKFILLEEEHNRKFYTGFLGEINIDNFSELYVNLRCMEVVEDTVLLYVGGGITKDSNPQQEWEETMLKTNTLKKVL